MKIDQKFTPKKISFLATGSEIIFGDLQESNCYRFSKIVSQQGGDVYQHVHSSDRKDEIICSMHYLLASSNALVITGGLGPTSDDNTRFAVAEYIGKNLYFDESVWENIFQRLKCFHLPMTESNRQQALFPEGAVLYPNKNGSAYGFHVKWENKYIFVLPGPPKECTPLFEKYILPTLFSENFLKQKSILYWTTLGLIESEIAARVDGLSKSYNVETGYRWHYPYLDIKIISDHGEPVQDLIQKIDNLLKPHIVSWNQKNAFEILEDTLYTFLNEVYVVDSITGGDLKKNIRQEKIFFILAEDAQNTEDKIKFVIESSKHLGEELDYFGIVTFHCAGWFGKHKKYSHCISIPYRSKEVFDYAQHYAAWQLNQFIGFLKKEENL